MCYIQTQKEFLILSFKKQAGILLVGLYGGHGLQIIAHFSGSPNISRWVSFTQTQTAKYHVNWCFLILRTKRKKIKTQGQERLCSRGCSNLKSISLYMRARAHTHKHTHTFFFLWPLSDVTMKPSYRSQGYVVL